MLAIIPLTQEWFKANEVWWCQCCGVRICVYGDWCSDCNKKLEEYFESTV